MKKQSIRYKDPFVKMAKNQSSNLSKGWEPDTTCSEFILSLSLSLFSKIFDLRNQKYWRFSQVIFMVSQNTEVTKSTMHHHSTIRQPDINDFKKSLF